MQATNLSVTNGVSTFFTGIVVGMVIYKTRSYKWWLFAGCFIRMIGYGVMFRIRELSPSMAELFIVQLVQGVGDGMVANPAYVAATVNGKITTPTALVFNLQS
jgi:hypothetical protein